eukprot:TRINITY_DN454_c0_g1_i1.p1 TRINITY_DN454_c0_g1~~TRINITY_DN454_c0_g1_i1.p1  ORF type:complete len:297 (+),score=63.46 TRINITY_DN454_c0_g1_i1:153-1043(+)
MLNLRNNNYEHQSISVAWDDGDTDDSIYDLNELETSEINCKIKVNSESNNNDDDNKIGNVDLLIIGLPQMGNTFIKKFFLEKNKQKIKQIGTISMIQPQEILEKSYHLYGGGSNCEINKITPIYRYKDEETSIVLLNMNFAPSGEESIYLTNAICDTIKPEKTIILDSLHTSSYINHNLESKISPILRKLSTMTAKKHSKDTVDYLETSNIIDSTSAAIISYCEMHHLYATVYISMQDSYLPNEDAFAAYEIPFFKDFKINKICGSILPNENETNYVDAVSDLQNNLETKQNPLYI